MLVGTGVGEAEALAVGFGVTSGLLGFALWLGLTVGLTVGLGVGLIVGVTVGVGVGVGVTTGGGGGLVPYVAEVTVEDPKRLRALTVMLFTIWLETFSLMQLVEVVAAHATVPLTFTS